MAQNRSITTERKVELYKEVIPIAEKFRQSYLDGDSPIKDTFETMERLGFFVVRFPAHNDLSGFHINKAGFDCVFINSAHTLGRQYFSAWHECYHAYTGEGGGVSLQGAAEHDEMEQKADFFAGCILMPENQIENYLQENRLSNLKYIKIDELIMMQNHFRVSYASLLTRLVNLYPHYRNDLSTRWAIGGLKQKERMLQIINRLAMDEQLVQPTNDFSVPKSFYHKLQQNLEDDRISTSGVQEIFVLIESISKAYE
ncbi:ImmA/IrrE family metallo-endopeptidase [Sporosarcina sp. E16_8]|uniref:ImmA/IrrE family metallo-endopeptidase n=1 Tax=Sporosarcina sp. E16_8 TaxID=2789295 RepID=UPI001A9224ED|nr:ImmA/IrrE family metallo-endopeptidase [Sporosarcina sp. E16_8]MBO0588412.1 ImmA/IrrE family metallo-endopeptidase [Sporosarcina sp. E16_8]